MSTPIDKIPDDPHRTLDEDQELVQSIIKEIKQHEAGSQPEQQMELQQEYIEEPEPQAYSNMQNNRPLENSQYYHNQEPDFAKPVSKPPQQKTFLQKLIHESKDPIIILLLYIAFGVPLVDRLLLKSIPRLMTTAGNLGFTGVIFKGVLLTLFFFVIKKFVK